MPVGSRVRLPRDHEKKQNSRVSFSLRATYYYRERERGWEERLRRESLAYMYERWLSTPVIKYGAASEGSQHARASALRMAREPSPRGTPRVFAFSLAPLPLHRLLKPRPDQSSEFIYLIVTAA